MQENETKHPATSGTQDSINTEAMRVKRIVKNAIREYEGFPEIEGVDFWLVPESDTGGDLVIRLNIDDDFTSLSVQHSIYHVADNVYAEIKEILMDEKVRRIFGIEETEIDFLLGHHTERLIVDYLIHLPHALNRAIKKALLDTAINHIRKSIEPCLREKHPKRRTRLLDDNSRICLNHLSPDLKLALIPALEHTEAVLSEYTSSLHKDRKTWYRLYSDEQILERYNQLRDRYKVLGKRYKDENGRFIAQRRSRNGNAWNKLWSEICDREFPDLVFATEYRSEIGAPSASVCAERELAHSFDYSIDHIHKQLNRIRRSLKNTR